VSVVCDVNESNPPVNCLVIINCTTCDHIISQEFNDNTEVRVIPLNDYYISVQVIREDNGEVVEDYSVVETLSVPERNADSGSSCKFVTLASYNAWTDISMYLHDEANICTGQHNYDKRKIHYSILLGYQTPKCDQEIDKSLSICSLC